VNIKIIGAGLAGSECAYQLASRGHRVDLFEMRPVKMTPAHQTSNLAELVCSNSFRSSAPVNAVGLLKREMTMFDSLVIRSGEAARVPAGDAFAVDRDRFSAAITEAIVSHKSIALKRDEITSLDYSGYDALVVATGPLTSHPLFEAINDFLGRDGLYFYDAIAPILAAESLDYTKLYWKSRYDKGESSDYLNAPMTKEQYEGFVVALSGAELYPLHDFEKAAHFEGCLPIEEIASRGIETLRFGPMKPVGLEHPVTGERAHAVVQLRKEDLSDEFFNIVGFQTKMKVPEQKRVIQMIPGLENASFARFGSMHRNTFINGPRHLRNTFQTKRDPKIFFAGQITGVEGYVESAAVGLLVARYIDDPSPMPYHTALGALGRHVAESSPDRYQPSNVTWALIEDRVGRARKAEKRERQVAMALEAVAAQSGSIAQRR
jgi:methylenetetrahydrofolate--tRNA-(uracil-5-)-methyltransferase